MGLIYRTCWGCTWCSFIWQNSSTDIRSKHCMCCACDYYKWLQMIYHPRTDLATPQSNDQDKILSSMLVFLFLQQIGWLYRNERAENRILKACTRYISNISTVCCLGITCMWRNTSSCSNRNKLLKYVTTCSAVERTISNPSQPITRPKVTVQLGPYTRALNCAIFAGCWKWWPSCKITSEHQSIK